ncbi:MAG: hypothetical protein EZS28_050057 [Streblomastix strix]|uniref:Uncharacterized protein n=1 Tax=Streblomastix strix TaxID=222440 RepID=A0A5J4T7J9_9EUKA|nr:MAG: hypothetical protein EZS28_050057 [Streblomastix strix]
MLNQLGVQYEPKSTKPVLEQLLLQTIKAQGYNGPKSNITKISELVRNKVQEKTAINVIENNETTNDENNEQDDEQELIQLQQQRIKATQELKLAAEKLDGINKQIELRQQVGKLQEQSTRLNNANDQLNEIKAFDLVKNSMRNRQQINDAKRQLQELKDKQVQQISEIKQQRINELSILSKNNVTNTRAMLAHNLNLIQQTRAAKMIQRQY